ncbi:MAG: hypothetical protein ACLFPL_00035 [Candidatus Nanoarchaeia archaeon]
MEVIFYLNLKILKLLHYIYLEREYLIFKEYDESRSWDCTSSFLRGFEENTECLPEYLEKYSPAHVICFGTGTNIEGIVGLLSREPDFTANTQHYGNAYVFLNAHNEL